MESIRSDEIVGLWSYLHTIDWSEKWLWVLGSFHMLCVLMTYLTRNGGRVQASYFVILLMSVYFAEWVNELAAKNWKHFSHQQYFDSGGLFISVVYSVPLLINCLVILVLWLLSTGNILVNLKRIKVRQMAKYMKNKQKEEETKKDE